MYTNLNDLLKEFTPEELAILTGDPSGSVIDQARVDYAISNASNLIDSFLRNRFDVPFNPVPILINFVARELAVANLYEYYNHDGVVPTSISRRKSYALYLLRQIQNGDLQLDIADNSRRPVLMVNKDKDSRIFGNDILDTFVEM